MTTVTDIESLISDFQTLLTHPHPTPTITVPSKTLSLPRHILSARSPYFRTLLSPRWHAPLTKPNTTAPQFQDLLEFLTTGCITLSTTPAAIPHNIALAALAHETLTLELEQILTTHITQTITTHTLPDYLRHLQTPVPPVDIALSTFLTTHTDVLPSLPHDPKTVTQICRLLSTIPLPPAAFPPTARYITTSRTPLRLLSSDPRLHAFLLSFPTPLFIRHFAPSGLFTPHQLLTKYRRDALVPIPTPPPRPPTVRLLHESPHPHPRPPRLEDTVTRVVVPGGQGYAKLLFDKRSSLAGGAELAFYIHDPTLGTHPSKFLVGTTFDTSFVLPAPVFWYEFSCTDVDPEEGGVFESRWGWRFFVESCSPHIDCGPMEHLFS